MLQWVKAKGNLAFQPKICLTAKIILISQAVPSTRQLGFSVAVGYIGWSNKLFMEQLKKPPQTNIL